jgi:hypothetical protein
MGQPVADLVDEFRELVGRQPIDLTEDARRIAELSADAGDGLEGLEEWALTESTDAKKRRR